MHIQNIPFCVCNESSGADYSDHLFWRQDEYKLTIYSDRVSMHA